MSKWRIEFSNDDVSLESDDGDANYDSTIPQIKNLNIPEIIIKDETIARMWGDEMGYSAMMMERRSGELYATSKIAAKAKTFKKSTKTKKYTIKLKTGNKAMPKVKVYVTIKGKKYKKTIKATTNTKGQAVFKIKKLTKKGKYKATITFKGNKNYKASKKTVQITIK